MAEGREWVLIICVDSGSRKDRCEEREEGMGGNVCRGRKQVRGVGGSVTSWGE